jgi:predicted TIM-barrel fold metal-dependent hydrolase
VRVVLDHAGNPPWRVGPPMYGLGPVLDLKRFDQLVIKFATINLERLHAAGVDPVVALRMLVDSFGANRIMWGSDAPNTPGNYTDMVRWISAVLADFSSDERAWILAGTALRVYPRLQAA